MKIKIATALASVSSFALMSGASFAQEEGTARQETVVVTGSRIPTDPNLVSSVPVQSVDSDDIRMSGELNLADIVNDIPALISSTTGENTTSSGSNALNLRGLGSERTLTLVNGRRHVAGFRGSQAVDVGTIPRALVESVEVTTGGASAVYGADAVTGVVNFILKDDFEGIEATGQYGVSGQGDADTFSFDITMGDNFDNDRGNIVFTASIERDSGLTYGDRDWSRDNGVDSLMANPALRFQPGELNADTPNFNSIYGSYGGRIPSADDPALDGLALTEAELALIARAAGAPARAIVSDPSYWLTANEGLVAPAFGGRGTNYIDANGNGVPDCQESFSGQIGYLAGCWVTNPDGTISVFQDGLIADGSFLGSGGMGARAAFNQDTLFPATDRNVINLNGHYDFTPTLTGFFEAKYTTSDTEAYSDYDVFYDTLWIYSDNPYIPDALQPVADTTGYLLLTKDPIDLNEDTTDTHRETYRFVGGFEWEPVEGHTVEVAANHGRFQLTQHASTVYTDRLFAAMDVVMGPDGTPVCRSDIDPTTGYEIDYFTASSAWRGSGVYYSNEYFTFTPGDGQCQPLNPFGLNAASPEAQDFVTARTREELTVEQTVLSAVAFGEFDVLQNFVAGPIGYAAGVEYREESSNNVLSDNLLGILPAGSAVAPGELVADVDPYAVSILGTDNAQQFNTGGSYDVYDVYAEVRVPLLANLPLAEELSIDGAVRYANYSTSGGATTWKVGATWAPVSDLSFRATVSEAVRAPNISELFDPPLPILVGANQDPCGLDNINNGSAYRMDNCIADLQAAGVALGDIVDGDGNYIWENPITGRFSGVSGGNEDLDPETANSLTVGAVFQPSFVENLTFTVDYWEVEIEDAIRSVGASDILEGCLDSQSFPSVPFCGQYTRSTGGSSLGGLNGLTSGQINFASLEASGVDFSASYSFDYMDNTFGARLVGSYQEKLDQYYNPLDSSDVNPAVGEMMLPELSGNLLLSWERGPMTLGLQTTYQDEQSVAGIEDIDLYGQYAFFDETFIFDLTGSYEFNERISFFGGINNLADEEPFSTQTAWPVGPRGRYFFMGFNYVQ
ncbi:TonB-dependent receptor [Ponticaulis sp.]|uniref:TonB-dependent receptor domain-containing protein n=1 Tax=Ponticaulis sp. TaxID=2020902 RepID=UPI000B6474FA|nr:TonB-dependent receptor [Ponticaulis sp.]OUY00081.1 MAG: outer membrane cobalamin receptor protein [Hyphomonadaceae bacterium TMED5]|tara:strand:- start:7222 stop:10455 length:3234 start_codon:yes stop_codon:yes gene_type:complete